MTLLILYEELAAYFISCISTFAGKYDVRVHVFRKSVNEEAPFRLDLTGIQVYDRSAYTDDELLALAERIRPDGILCGGWATPVYMRIAARFNKEIPVVIGFDNNWEGSLKQRLATLVAPFYITNRFNGCFVPGPGQKLFAEKMGFRSSRIRTGAYSCDFNLFHSEYLRHLDAKRAHFPKRFLYVGRYVEHKGIRLMWESFAELYASGHHDWELWCIGTGDVAPLQHPAIRHFGFVQPEMLSSYIRDTGVFILPSLFEPWGVVVHEFAAAGFPLICSDRVGARIDFVENDINGYIYKAGDKTALKLAMARMMGKTQSQLLKMSSESVNKASKITPVTWSENLYELLK